MNCFREIEFPTGLRQFRAKTRLGREVGGLSALNRFPV